MMLFVMDKLLTHETRQVLEEQRRVKEASASQQRPSSGFWETYGGMLRGGGLV